MGRLFLAWQIGRGFAYLSYIGVLFQDLHWTGGVVQDGWLVMYWHWIGQIGQRLTHTLVPELGMQWLRWCSMGLSGKIVPCPDTSVGPYSTLVPWLRAALVLWFVMDWQIGSGLALDCRIFDRLSDWLVLGWHFENRSMDYSRIGILVKDWHWIGVELAMNCSSVGGLFED